MKILTKSEFSKIHRTRMHKFDVVGHSKFQLVKKCFHNFVSEEVYFQEPNWFGILSPNQIHARIFVSNRFDIEFLKIKHPELF